MPKNKLSTMNLVGGKNPVFVIGEIGLNHNGSIDLAKKLINVAAAAGCDAVKFQKRTPEICVPPEQANIMRETPWGTMKYIDYRHRVEFGKDEYKEIDRHCKELNIEWFSSCWDIPSLEFMETFNPSYYKIASACLTDTELLKKHKETGKTIILSTGMSSMEQIEKAVSTLGKERLIIMHCTSTYPCPAEELNLNMIATLRKQFGVPVGYSGHETGLSTTVAAVALGACSIERHITLDRAMWGSDQAASIEPHGLMRLVRDVRTVENAMGDGVKKVYDSELPIMKKLRRKAA